MRKIFMILLIGMFLISLASAEVFTFDNIKQYDKETKTVTIINTLGFSKLSEIKLDTSWCHFYNGCFLEEDGVNVKVTPGRYTQVAQFEITNLKKYNQVLNELRFYDKKNNDREIIPIYDIKVYSNVSYEYQDIDEKCLEQIKLGNDKCKKDFPIKVGYYMDWVDIDLKNKELIKDEVLTIGIFTTPIDGDYIEWIPTMYGKTIEEWAAYSATGGTITTDGLYTIHTFTSSGWFNWTGTTTDVEVLIVAGGGGAGGNNYNGAGAGAGGLIYTNNSVAAGNYAVVVGNGGTWGNNNYGTNGTNSSFNSLVAWGGGGSGVGVAAYKYGLRGGSGSGGAPTTGLGGTTFDVTQGNNGAAASESNAAAGGGGSSEAGVTSGGSNVGGRGGNGTAIGIYNGTPLWYAAGGQGGGLNAPKPTYGGGGIGGDYGTGAGEDGGDATTPGSGGGGGMCDPGNCEGGDGADGIVIIRYLTSVDNIYNPLLTLDSPANYLNTTNNVFVFNATATDLNEAGTIVNATLYIDGILNETNSTVAINQTYHFEKIIADGSHNWSVLIYNNNSKANQSATRFFTIDSNNPSVNIIYPTNTTYTTNYLQEDNFTIWLNWTSSDANLDKCWYSIDGGETNTTITCNANSTIYKSAGQYNFSVWANDTFGRLGRDDVTATWNYVALETLFSYNTGASYSSSELYTVNISTNGSTLANPFFSYDGNLFPANVYGSGSEYIVNYSQVVSSLGTFDLFFMFDVEGININTTTRQQTVNTINFSLCSGTNNVEFLNVTFKDEDDLSTINASIDLVDVDFWLTPTSSNNYVDSRLINQSNYSFCFNPGSTQVSLNMTFKYSLSGYPLRTYTLTNQNFTNSTTNTTLYLLSSADGDYNFIQVVNIAGDPISGVYVLAERQILGFWVTVASEITGDDGLVSMWVNPNYKHRFTFSKTGYITQQQELTPSPTTVYITLQSSTETVANDYAQGVVPYVYPPTSTELVNDTSYTFIYNLTSSVWTVSHFGFTLTLDNGTIVGRGYSTTPGTGATFTYNVNNQTKINMEYYYVVDGNYRNTTGISWVVTNSLYKEYSLKTFFTDFNRYLDEGIFGLDNFGRLLIVFLILFFVVGVMGFKYGMKNPIFIGSITFITIFFFDIVVNLIPAISIAGGKTIDNLLTYIAGLALVIIIWRESR